MNAIRREKSFHSARILVVVISVFFIAFAAEGLAKELVFKYGTSGLGGTWFRAGAVMSEIITKNVPDVQSVAVASGAVKNVKAVDAGTFGMGLAHSTTSKNGWDGNFPFDKKHRNIRGLTATGTGPIQIVARADTNIYKIKDLADKRIAVGVRNWASEIEFRNILAAYGLSYDSIQSKGGKISYAGHADMTALMKDRHVDAIVSPVGVPAPGIIEIQTVFPIRLIPVDEKVVEGFIQKGTGVVRYVIRAGSYKNQDKDVLAVGYRTLVIVGRHLPTQAVYQATKAIFENVKEVHNVHPSWKQMRLEEALEGMSIPLHPGAAKYYREKKLNIPAGLLVD